MICDFIFYFFYVTLRFTKYRIFGGLSCKISDSNKIGSIWSDPFWSVTYVGLARVSLINPIGPKIYLIFLSN